MFAESEVTMSIGRLRTGLLSVMLACGAFTIAKAEDDDKSYLPPPSFRGTSETAQYPSAAVQPRKRSIRITHRRTYQRNGYVSLPRLLFNIFN